MNPILEYASGLEKVVQNEPEIRILAPQLGLPNYVMILLKRRLDQIKKIIEHESLMMGVERNG